MGTGKQKTEPYVKQEKGGRSIPFTPSRPPDLRECTGSKEFTGMPGDDI